MDVVAAKDQRAELLAEIEQKIELLSIRARVFSELAPGFTLLREGLKKAKERVQT
jgi:hypothetical protein